MKAGVGDEARLLIQHATTGRMLSVVAGGGEEVAAEALEVALAELRKRMDAAEPKMLEAELSELDRKIERALDLAIELGDMGAAKAKLQSLRGDRERVATELAQARVALPKAEELIPRLREKLRDISAALKADVGLGRMALGSLLGESLLRVYADGRIKGLATLDPEMVAAPRRTPEPRQSVVAGGRYARSCRPVLVALPVAGEVSVAAASG